MFLFLSCLIRKTSKIITIIISTALAAAHKFSYVVILLFFKVYICSCSLSFTGLLRNVFIKFQVTTHLKLYYLHIVCLHCNQRMQPF